ncbi:unnamed protein product, partial [marine sediment metagenome]
PFAMCYADEMDRFLMPRFDDSGRYKFIANVDRIPALELRKLEKISAFRDVLTIDEAREIIGKKPHDNAEIGAQLLKPQGGSSKPTEGAKSREDFIVALMDRGHSEIEAEQKACDVYGCH